jgi:zinc protease
MPRSLLLLTLVLALLTGACGTSERVAEPAQQAAPATAEPTAQAAPAAAPGNALPVDPNVRIGRLPSGVTYYVRRNTEPENRAELRLAVDAGAVLETDAQRGLAHFLASPSRRSSTSSSAPACASAPTSTPTPPSTRRSTC